LISTPTTHASWSSRSPPISSADSSSAASADPPERRTENVALAALAHPARLVRSARQRIVRILDDWPTADALLTAYTRVNLLT